MINSGSVRKFEFNRAQQYIHERLEAQLAATSKVRALVLKGRQQGVSALIQAKIFSSYCDQKDKKLYSHDLSDATRAIFEMTKRYSGEFG